MSIENQAGACRFRRALDDLTEGLRCLLGHDARTPTLVDELLASGSEIPAPEPTPRARLKSVPPRSRSRDPRGRKSHLVVIK